LSPAALLIRFKDWWRQDYPSCRQWHVQARDDFKFRAGDQWRDEERR
jgi:hypothetical protein